MNKVAVKPKKNVPAKHILAFHVLTNFDDNMQRSSMKSSKLEECLFILQIVAQKGPLKPTTIMSEFKINRSLLEDCLELLVNQNLIIEETGYSNKVICDITEGGDNVLKFFKLDVPTKTSRTFQF